MVRYLVGRVLWAVWMLLAVTVVTYVLFFVVPGPNHSAANGYAPSGFGSPGATARVERSLVGEYLGYLHHLTRGDLGSVYDRDRPDHPYPASKLVSSAIPPTLSLIAGAVLLWATIGLAVGAWSALRPRSIGDRLGTRFVQLAASAHPVWWGLVLSYVFGYLLRNYWIHTPIAGYCSLTGAAPDETCGGGVQWAYHLILPGIVFGAGLGAMYARTTRATVLDALHEDHVRTARAKGLSEGRVVRRHVFPNAFGPLVTMLTADLGALFGGTVFIESVFNIPGLGRLALTAFNRDDLSLLAGVTITVSLIAVVASLLVDLVLALVNPPKVDGWLIAPGPRLAKATSDPRSPPFPPYR